MTELETEVGEAGLSLADRWGDELTELETTPTAYSCESWRVSSSVLSELFTSSSMSIETTAPMPPSRCVCCRWSSERLVRKPAASHLRIKPLAGPDPELMFVLAVSSPLLMSPVPPLPPPPPQPPFEECSVTEPAPYRNTC
uniref:Uncharacterized protein n=1 Tax=Anopheles melas TaxID=34690 RepID=A0A182U5Z5_9DIPT